jgi:hypothetical protein
MSLTSFVKPRLLAAACIFTLALSLLALTIKDYGFTWDEAEINFPAARNQADWWRHFWATGEGLSESDVTRHFFTESDHPSLPRSLMAIARCLLPASVPDRIAFAFPTAVLAALFTAAFFLTLQNRLGWTAGLGGTFLLLLHPRWFADAHFAEYDIQIAMAWWLAAAAFYWAVGNTQSEGAGAVWREWARVVAAAFCYGLAISIKLHAFFLPFPLLLWALLFRKVRVWKWLAVTALVAPVVYLGTQPYLWWDTLPRLIQRFQDYGSKVPITTYYFGQWFPGNVPWHYPWVMLAVTLPPGLLLFLLIRFLSRLMKGNLTVGCPDREWTVFLLLNAVAVPALFSWKSPYDGIRFFLPTLPFLAVFAAQGIHALETGLAALPRPAPLVKAVRMLVALMLLAQAWTCWRLHPDQLAYYSFVVGGVPGANHLGLETTYWCDSITPGFVQSLAQQLPENARIATHAMDKQPLEEYQRAGLAPKTWTFTKEGPVHARIVQFRQGFFGPKEAELIGSREPLLERTLEGVPLVRAYRGP